MSNRSLKDVIAGLADQQQRLFFYSKLKNPKLLDELRKIGVYDDPPAIRQEDGRTYFPIWPQARYLVNVAGDIPDKVAALIREIKTDNPAVAMDFCQAILKMPAGVAKTLLKPLASWTGLGGGLILYALLDVVDLFADGGEADAAIKLGSALLDVQPGKPFEIESIGYRKIDAVATIEDSNYSFALDRVLKATSAREPQKVLMMLATLLSKSLEIEGVREGHDLSAHWLSDLGKDPIGFGAKELLAHRLFVTAMASARDGSVALTTIYGILDGGKSAVFRRVKVALQSEFDDGAQARAELNDQSFYAADDLKRERNALLRKFYPTLSPKEKTDVLLRIRDAVTSEEVAREYFGQRLQGDDLERAIVDARDEELYRTLEGLEPYLTGSDAEQFASLKTRFSREEEPGPKDGEVWVGPTSPKSPEELEKMSTPEILDYASTWVPKRGWFQHTPEGFGRTLEPIVAGRLGEFLGCADAILRLHPIYVRHIIGTLRQHLRDSDFDFDAFITILEYVLVRSSDAAEGMFDSLDDPEDGSSWSHLQQTIAFGLTDLFRSKLLPLTLRDRVFSILAGVLEDSDPSVESDAKYGSDSAYGPPWQLALNSARGAGMLALFDYARWIYAAIDVKGSGRQLIEFAPEVFEALDRRLDAATEPTKAVRSTFGQNFVSMYAMSRDWMRSQKDRIFTADSPGEAAWRAYVVFNRAYDEIYSLLEENYANAVANIEKDGDQQDRWDATGNLGIHLVTAYLHGLIRLEGSLLESYTREASSESVGHTLTSLGNALIRNEELPGDMPRLSMELYDLALAIFADRPEELRHKALGNFGIWMQSPQLPADWILDRFIRTLRLTGGRVAWETRVFDTLQGLSATFAQEAVQSLFELTFGSYSTIFMTDEPIRVILKNAIRAGGAALDTAVRTNNRLADMGITRYNDLFQ